MIKKLESDQQRQTNIFVLQSLFKKLHMGANPPLACEKWG